MGPHTSDTVTIQIELKQNNFWWFDKGLHKHSKM